MAALHGMDPRADLLGRSISANVPAVADARESQRAGVPKGEPPQAATRQPPCYLPTRPA